MTQEEAEALAEQLNRDAPDKDAYQRVARQRGEIWEVVKVSPPGELRRESLTETVGSDEKPPQPDDPRSAYQRLKGGAWG